MLGNRISNILDISKNIFNAKSISFDQNLKNESKLPQSTFNKIKGVVEEGFDKDEDFEDELSKNNFYEDIKPPPNRRPQKDCASSRKVRKIEKQKLKIKN